jgi:hypothetical protein
MGRALRWYLGHSLAVVCDCMDQLSAFRGALPARGDREAERMELDLLAATADARPGWQRAMMRAAARANPAPSNGNPARKGSA